MVRLRSRPQSLLNAKETPRRLLFSRHAGASMTVAFQPRTNGPAHRGQSRFFASPPRAPRHRHARPAKRLAGQKTAPGIFFAAPPKTHPETVTQVTNTHQESTTYVFVFAPGCAVAPNNAGASGNSSGVTFGFGVTANVPGSSASATYTKNNLNLNVTAAVQGGFSVIAGPTMTVRTGVSGPTVFSLGGTLGAGLAGSLNLDFTVKSVFGLDILPELTDFTVQGGWGAGASGKLGLPSPSLNLIDVNVTPNGVQKGGVLTPYLIPDFSL